jgi:ubiquinone/menaquinone biosynthesis C-methylase UbiE
VSDSVNTKVHRQRQDWDELAGFNAEWAVLSDPETRFSGWDQERFFATGDEQIEKTMKVAAELGLPQSHRSVLDFGCGVGRLSRALSRHFDRYTGVDISPEMIARARELSGDAEERTFVANEAPDLSRFDDGQFDMVVSFLVLQHIADRDQIRAYLAEFARVLAPGGLIAFQIPSRLPLIYRIGWRRRVYRVIRALGVSVERAQRLRMHNMSMQALPEREVREVFESAGCELAKVDSGQATFDEKPLGGGVDIDYYVTKR